MPLHYCVVSQQTRPTRIVGIYQAAEKLGKVKHIEELVGGLSPGSKVTVVGQVTGDPFRFDIDLLKDANGRYIVMHFCPKFTDYSVLLNSCTESGWGNGERHRSFPFTPGAYFKMEIRCEHDQFNLSVNGNSFADYKYRMPLGDVKFIRISEDIQNIQVTKT